MPTGYTYKICEGKPQTFKEFALSCARAFGALITMRDDDPDAPIPDEIKPDDYYQRLLETALAELAEFQSLSTDELRQRQKQEHAKAVESHSEYEQKKREQNARLQAMLNQVNAWQPPSPEHVEYKKFMVNQLEISMDTYTSPPPALRPFDKWKAERISQMEGWIEIRRKSAAEEIERANGRTEWIQQLKNSLKGQQ